MLHLKRILTHSYVIIPYRYYIIRNWAIHLAIKQKKVVALCTLLVMNPDLTIPNDGGQTPNDLSLSIHGKKLSEFQRDAYVCSSYYLV